MSHRAPIPFFVCYSKESCGGEALFGPDVVYFGEPYRTRSNPKKPAEEPVGSFCQARTRCVCFFYLSFYVFVNCLAGPGRWEGDGDESE